MIFVCVVSCFMVIYWGGCALDETVIPLLFSLTDGKFPPPNAFGEPVKWFTAVITYSEAVFIVLQISVLLLEAVAFLYVLCKEKFSLQIKLTAGLGVVCTVVFVAVPASLPYILFIKALLSVIYLVFIILHMKLHRQTNNI